MATGIKKINSALISVFSKDGLEPLAKKLNELGVKIYSTGGTQKFIEAEAAFRTNDLERSATAYNEAIYSSIANIETAYSKAMAIIHPDLQADSLEIIVNNNILTFLDKMATETAQSINLEKILTQKYITSFFIDRIKRLV